VSVTYQLSWEEFLEIYQDWLPSPSIASFVSCLFIATAVGIFGIVLTYAVDSRSKLMASSFCWLSLILFGAAFWDLRVRTAVRRRRGTRNLRSTYDQYYSGEREFAFDQGKWTLRTNTGKQEALWAGLMSAVERQSIINLLAANQLSAAIPKRVLSSEALDSLRIMALGQPELSWLSSVTLPDYLLTEIPSLWRRHPFLMAEAHCAGLLLFLLIAADMYHTAGPGAVWGWALAGLFLFFTVTAQLWYFLIEYLTSHRSLAQQRTVGISGQGVHIKMTKENFFVSWGRCRKAEETSRCFLLYLDSARYYIFPKKFIPIAQQGILRQLIDDRLSVNRST